MQVISKQLAEGVHLTYLPARKFKTSLLSAQFVTPLRQETVAANALLAAVLRRGTVSYPDLGALSARMDNLYGARVDYTVRKKGETQCVGFVASFIDDSFVPGGEKLLEPVAELVGQLICEPVTHHGRFVPAYFESEKANLIDAIRSQVNDKRDYADARLLEEMCAGEPYGISRLGREKDAERLQPPEALCPIWGADLHQLPGAHLLRQRVAGAGGGGAAPGVFLPAQGRHLRKRAHHGPRRGGRAPLCGRGYGRDSGEAGHGLFLQRR